MIHKPTSEFTAEEKEWMDTIAVNYVVAQSDGFQLGYAQAINDFKESIIDYWNGSDDKPQQSVLDALVDIGVELGKRKQVVEKNIETAKDKGYEQYYNWNYKTKYDNWGINIGLYTLKEKEEVEE